MSLRTWLDHQPHRLHVVSLQDYLRHQDAAPQAAGPLRHVHAGPHQRNTEQNPRGHRCKRRHVETDSDSEPEHARARCGIDSTPSVVT